jgi:hypothetical protein
MCCNGNVKKVDKLVLCLPGSNGSTERGFSHTNYCIWSEEGSRLHVDKLQVILAAKTNAGLSCEAFSEKLSSNLGVLK